MKKYGCMFLAVILSLALVITPVMAKGGGNGGHSGGGKGSSTATGNSGNNGSANVKDNANSNAGGNKDDSTNQGQANKDSNVNSGKKTTDGVDLTRGNKELIQQRIQSKEVITLEKQFKDTQGHWAQNSIRKVQQLELMQGYEDGSFNPDAVISQAEAIVMVVNLAELTDETGSITDNTEDENTGAEEITDETTIDDGIVSDEEDNITDVPAWARNQARKASLAKIININRFHSEVQASRAQVAVMLAKALGLEPIEVDENAFTDTLKITPEDIGYILALKDAGVITGTPDGKFNPNSAITRAEIATMLAEILANIEDTGDITGDTTGDTGAQTGTAQNTII